MKILNEKNIEIQTEKNNETTSGLSFDMAVYREMADQTSESVDVFKMIQSQFEQIHQANAKRSFLLKEISQYFKS